MGGKLYIHSTKSYTTPRKRENVKSDERQQLVVACIVYRILMVLVLYVLCIVFAPTTV